MKPSRKTRWGRSVRSEKKPEHATIEMIFPDPVDEETPDAPADLTPAAGPDGTNGSRRDNRRESERIVFRF